MVNRQYIHARKAIACYSHVILRDVVNVLQEDYFKVLFTFYNSNTFFELEEAVYNANDHKINVEDYKKKFLKEW